MWCRGVDRSNRNGLFPERNAGMNYSLAGAVLRSEEIDLTVEDDDRAEGRSIRCMYSCANGRRCQFLEKGVRVKGAIPSSGGAEGRFL